MGRPCFRPLPPPTTGRVVCCDTDAVRVGVLSASTGSGLIPVFAGSVGLADGVSAGPVRRVCDWRSAGRRPAASGRPRRPVRAAGGRRPRPARAPGPRPAHPAHRGCGARRQRATLGLGAARFVGFPAGFLGATLGLGLLARFLGPARLFGAARSSAFLRASSARRASSACLTMAASRSVIRRDRRWSSRPSLLASARWAAICPSNWASSVERSFCWPTRAVFCSVVSATTFSISARRASALPCNAASRSMSARSACTAWARAWDT